MLSATPQNGTILVRWQSPGTNRVQLMYRTNAAESWRKIGSSTTGTSGTIAAPAGPACFFSVTTDLTPPAVPSGLRTATNGCGSVVFSWSASSDNSGGSGLKAYRIFRNGVFVTQVAAPAVSSVQSVLSPSTSYLFGVSAVDLADNESTMATVSVTTPSTVCPNQRPVANPGPSRTNRVGSASVFDGSKSQDPDGWISAYAWNFGDGTTATGTNPPPHAFANPGVYAVRLTVTDNIGATAVNTAIVTVVTAPPPIQLVSVAKYGYSFSSDVGQAVALDPAGNVFIGGDVNGIFLTKRSAAGTPLWSQPFIGSGCITALATDNAGNVFVTGNFYATANFGGGPLTSVGADDIFVAKFASDGTHLWSKRFGGNKLFGSLIITESGMGIAVDPRDNSVVVTGFMEDDVDFGGGLLSTWGSDMFLAKFTSEGTYLWSRAVNGGMTRGNSVAIDESGNIFVTGSFSLTVDFGGGPISTTASAETFLAKYSPAGLNLWTKHFGGQQSFGYAVALDHSGHVFLTGHFDADMSFGGTILTNGGTMDIFLAKLSAADGAHVWSKRFGSIAPDYGNSLAVDNDDNVFLVGSGRFFVDFGEATLPGFTPNDAFVAKFSTEGACRWSRIFGAGTEEAKAVAVNNDGHAFVVGRFSRTVDFGFGPITASGSWDIFLAEFAP